MSYLHIASPAAPSNRELDPVAVWVRLAAFSLMVVVLGFFCRP